MQQAIVKRVDWVDSKTLGKVYFTSMSLAEQGEVQTEALRYYRVDRLGYLLDELNVMRDRGLLGGDFDEEIDAVKREVSHLAFDDLPRMKLQLKAEDKPINVDYVRWFMARTVEGQIAAVFAAARNRHPDLTRDDLKGVMKTEPEFFIDAATVIADLTNSLIAKK